LNDALSATVDLIGDQVGGLFGRSKEGSSEASSVDTTSTGDLPPAEVPRTAPPADDVRQ
jgi:hypothetical protein